MTDMVFKLLTKEVEIPIEDFNGKVCPVMSGYQSRGGSDLKYVTVWVGIECLKEKCQWYGTRCEYDNKKNLILDVDK